MLSTKATGRFSEMNLFVAFPLLSFVLHNASQLVHLCTQTLPTLIVNETCVSHYPSNVQRFQSAGTRTSRSQGLTQTLSQPFPKEGQRHIGGFEWCCVARADGSCWSESNAPYSLTPPSQGSEFETMLGLDHGSRSVLFMSHATKFIHTDALMTTY